MAKQGKSLPARRTRAVLDDSLLIRSAESLGRMIGSLQRQLDGASKRLHANGSANGAGMLAMDRQDDEQSSRRTPKAAKASRATTPRVKAARKGGSTSASAKVRSQAEPAAARRASKSAVATKSAGRARPGAARKSAKSSR